MSDIDRLICAMAFDRAYAVVGNTACDVCGLPATCVVADHFDSRVCCDEHPKEGARMSDLTGAPAVRRLMKIAKGER